MRILVNERRVKEGQLVSCPMLFDIVFRSNLSNPEESKEEVNEKGTRFRNKVDELKPRGSWVGNFMPMSEDKVDRYAFFIITCPSGSRTIMKTIMKKITKDGNSIILGKKTFRSRKR